MEDAIHNLEREAYLSVLRAFTAQSSVLSWERDGFLMNLRTELRITDDEHIALLRSAYPRQRSPQIREGRQGGEPPANLVGASQYGHDNFTSPTVRAPLGIEKPQLAHGGRAPEVNISRSFDYTRGTSESRKGTQLVGPIRNINLTGGSSGQGHRLEESPGGSSGQGHRLEESPTLDQYRSELRASQTNRILSASYPDPLEKIQMKKMLHEQKQNLVNMISKLESSEETDSE